MISFYDLDLEIIGYSLFVCVEHQDFALNGTGASRCDLKEKLIEMGCKKEEQEYPISQMTVTENKPLSDKASGSTTDVTQIQPQKLHITLRPGEFRFVLFFFTFYSVTLNEI